MRDYPSPKYEKSIIKNSHTISIAAIIIRTYVVGKRNAILGLIAEARKLVIKSNVLPQH